MRTSAGIAVWTASVVLTAIVLAPSGAAVAHPGFDARLALLDRRIASDPDDAALHLRRAELHRTHGHRDAATADLERAAELDPDLPGLGRARGRLLLEAGRPADAVTVLTTHLARDPADALGWWLLRARAHDLLGRSSAAVADYDRAIVLAPAADLDPYLERARVLAAAGRVEEAVAGLEAARRSFAAAVVVDEVAYAIEAEAGRYEAALMRAASRADEAAHPELWLTRAAEQRAALGRPEAARRTYGAAAAALARRPPHRRATPALDELAARIRNGLERLDGGVAAVAGKPAAARSVEEEHRDLE